MRRPSFASAFAYTVLTSSSSALPRWRRPT